MSICVTLAVHLYMSALRLAGDNPECTPPLTQFQADLLYCVIETNGHCLQRPLDQRTSYWTLLGPLDQPCSAAGSA